MFKLLYNKLLKYMYVLLYIYFDFNKNLTIAK